MYMESFFKTKSIDKFGGLRNIFEINRGPQVTKV